MFSAHIHHWSHVTTVQETSIVIGHMYRKISSSDLDSCFVFGKLRFPDFCKFCRKKVGLLELVQSKIPLGVCVCAEPWKKWSPRLGCSISGEIGQKMTPREATVSTQRDHPRL